MELMACAHLVGGKMEQSCIFPDLIWYYQWYEILPKLSQSHLIYSRAIFVVDCCQFGPSSIVGWKWSLWPVPAWLVVQQSKSVFLLTLYVSINDMKYFRTASNTPQPCHSHFCCWLLRIWPKLDVWAESWAYGLCRLGSRYSRAKLSF